MSQPPIDIARLTADGVAALRERDFARARNLFQDIVTRSGASASAYLGLAFALNALKDFDAYLSALDSALALEPRNTRALLLKGDWLFEHGERRRAGGFYQVVLNNRPATPPPDLAQHLTRASNRMAELFADYDAHLRSKLSEMGYNPKTSSKRFTDALEMLMGRKQRDPGPQNPMVFFFPGLAALGFHPRSDTPWMGEIEAASVDIKTELEGVLRDPAAFSPYITLDPNSPYSGFAGMANKPDWSSFYLYKDGMRVAENVARCPKTVEALDKVPLCVMPGRGPSALYSWLLPGARIPPHCGIMNTTLICHLPLIVPDNCGFRVGAETREWRFGKGWAFDDTFEHEAWNRSRELRVILIFDVWRPDITIEERGLICAMWEAVDCYNSPPLRRIDGASLEN